MRNIVTKDDRFVYTECTNEPVSCWCQDRDCTTRCAAFTQAVMPKSDQTQDIGAVCAAMPQQMPLGVLEEGKVAVPVQRGPSIVRGH